MKNSTRTVRRLAALGTALLAASTGVAGAQTAAMPIMAILPPKRPPVLVTAEAAVTQGIAAPVATAATTAIPSSETPLSARAAVERANAYFNSINTLIADFIQIGGDGRRLSGKFYLQRPGKLRFEYQSPATLEVVADGSSVAVRDRKLATQDLYPIGQTPLKFLLRDRIDLARDVKITDVAQDAEGVRIALEDSSTLGGTSRITLFFDPAVESLTKWRIIDPQGFQTTVVLSNIDKGRRVDNRLFVINYERMLGDESKR